MAEIRGEKVRFRKQDIVALHELPSAQVENPLIVDTPAAPARGVLRKALFALATFSLTLTILAGLFLMSVESGYFDGMLAEKAEQELNQALGQGYQASVGPVRIRFASNFHLALEARAVALRETTGGRLLGQVGYVRLVLDPLRLLSGTVAVEGIEAAGLRLDPLAMASGKAVNLADLRVDQTPAVLEQSFRILDVVGQALHRTETGTIRLSNIQLTGGSGAIPVAIQELSFSSNGTEGKTLRLGAVITVNHQQATILATAGPDQDGVLRLDGSIKDLTLTPFMMTRLKDGRPHLGVDASADITLAARRGGEGRDPALRMTMSAKAGTVYVDLQPQPMTRADLSLAYAPAKHTFEIMPSVLGFGATVLPFTGAVIDSDRLDPKAPKGFGLDLLVSDGTAAGEETGEQPLTFSAKATGSFVPAERRVSFDTLVMTSPLGSMFGSMSTVFGEGEPAVSLALQSQGLKTAAIKQLWPYWIAPKARHFLQKNLFAGDVANAELTVYMPPDRPPPPAIVRLNDQQLHLSFDIAGARLSPAGEIPPVRDVAGHFDLTGSKLQLALKGGTSYLPSGQSVALTGGSYQMADIDSRPVMADLDLALAGKAQAMAELLTFKPVDVLSRTGFAVEDFTGDLSAELKLRFGPEADQSPPPPVWSAEMTLNDVTLKKPVSGHFVGSLNGTLAADAKKVTLQAAGTMDEVPMDLHLVEPVDKADAALRERIVRLSVSAKDRHRLFPGLDSLMDGSATAELKRIDDTKQSVTLDLQSATLSVPWIGWTKGAGVPAKAEFLLDNGEKTVSLKDFSLNGEGFGLKGDILLDKGGIVSGNFSRVRLSPADDYSLVIERASKALKLSIAGKSGDLRPFLARSKKGAVTAPNGQKPKAPDVILISRLDTVYGFSDEQIKAFELTLSYVGGAVQDFRLSGLTAASQPIVGQMVGDGGGPYMQITSGDAGKIARFTGIYNRMEGGLLNLRIRPGPGDGWNGSIDLRNYRLKDEQGLQNMVTTPVDPKGRSLNSVVHSDVDVSSQHFQRGFAHMRYEAGTLSLENGFMRGDQVGASFQGVLRDAQGGINITGTFMPAYGLNRILGELPVIGEILGNGNDHGVLGITFKLTGAFESPDLIINPLSIIAPGVFRQIFQFDQ